MNASGQYLNRQRAAGDASADLLVTHFFELRRQAELYEALGWTFQQKENIGSSVVKEWLLTTRDVKSFDHQKIERGQRFFEHQAVAIMTLLGGLALPYCYSGSPGNKALYLSEKMRQSPGKRLADTATFVLSVSTVGSLHPGGAGLYSINKTRLIHAIARHYLLTRSNWDLRWGYPINQEDMAGTNLAFSFIVLSGLQKSGLQVSERERDDFLYLWHYIGYQLNIDEQLLPASFREASLLEYAIRRRNFKKSDEGIELMHELLAHFKTVAPKEQLPLLQAQVRYWVGNEVADLLGLQAQPLRSSLVSSLNSFRELINIFQPTQHSLALVLKNQEKMKQWGVGSGRSS
jgi:hypothetical protein